MRVWGLLISVGVFALANVTTSLLSEAGYENAPLMVLGSALVAAVALHWLIIRNDHDR